MEKQHTMFKITKKKNHVNFNLIIILLTELVFGDQRLRDARWPAAKLVLSSDPEDVLLPLDELGDREAGSLQGGGDGDPADLVVLIVLLLQDVIQDLAAAVVLGRVPVADDRGVPDFIEGEVDRRAGFVCHREEPHQL